jgi:hypothetical protein
MSGIRMTEGASGAVPTPPSGKETLFADDTLHAFASEADPSATPTPGGAATRVLVALA